MTGTSFILLSFAVTHGVPIALALRDLRRLGTTQPRGGDEPPPPEMPRPKPLPDCLLPVATPRPSARLPERVLEDA